MIAAAPARTAAWEEVRSRLTSPDLGLNMGRAALPGGGREALRFTAGGAAVSHDELAARAERFAALLAALGVRRGDRVAVLLDPGAALAACSLGTLLHGAVLTPLFTSYGPEAVGRRLRLGRVRVLVTTPVLHQKKVAPVRSDLPGLDAVLLTGSRDVLPAGTASLELLLAGVGRHHPEPTEPDEPALLHFTSGTTGEPKGVVQAHEAIVAQVASAELALDVRPGDVVWCTAQPGWVTATIYGLVAPLAAGATLVVDAGCFDARRWYDVVAGHGVDVWYTSPTAVRLLLRAGDEAAAGRDLSSLRVVASVGEPLDPEAVPWGERVLGRPILDGWWQTETGAITVANLPGDEPVPGSMGRPLPGIEAAVAWRNAHGDVTVHPEGLQLVDDGTQGELVLRPGWPSMFRSYLDDPQRYGAAFVGGWYRSGDLVRRDRDGRFWFCGRGDDAISSAGHLIGPVEVERTLRSHPAVAHAAVVGAPDALAGEVVHAFVVAAPGARPGDDLALELVAHARRRLGPALAPRDVTFVDELPVNASGKVVRRVLRERAGGR